ncbi:MAG: hypothetical protein EOO46_15600 [Flavobacterium sp.]|nr:MAG: hypothetical protein EOO46_15600 [Flavobacterium sp.]
MSDTSNKWKDFLLKSSIPLEYEVKQLLDKYGCVGRYEFTYLRHDENEIINEFSYDIDASYIKGTHFFDLMIECKYRDVSTNWIFIPEEYGGMDEIEHHCFINPNDHFTQSNKFLTLDYEPYAPLCGKGIEINSNGHNPKSITQAINQLSYGTAEKVISGMEHQIEKYLGTTETIFYTIPIIVTTANLYRLKENVTINEIKNSSDIAQISTKEDCLVLKTPAGKHLENYNLEKFSAFIEQYGADELNKILHSFNENIEFVCSVIAKNYCPNAMAIIQFTDHNSGFKKLFDFLNEVVSPTEKTLKRQRQKQEKLQAIMKKLDERK